MYIQRPRFLCYIEFAAMFLLQAMFQSGYQTSAVPPLIQHLRDVITVDLAPMTVTTVKMLLYPVLNVSIASESIKFVCSCTY